MMLVGQFRTDKFGSEWIQENVRQDNCSEVYLEKAFDNIGFRPEKRLPNAVDLGETSLMFLVHPTLTKAEVDKTVSVIKQVFGLASK